MLPGAVVTVTLCPQMIPPAIETASHDKILRIARSLIVGLSAARRVL
jgi:hypothetical protein